MKKLILIAITSIFYINLYSQGEGELTINNINHCHSSNDCVNIQSLTAHWYISSLMGEVLSNVQFKWVGAPGCKENFFDGRDFIVLKCVSTKSQNLFAYVRSGCNRPISGKGYPYNVGTSPSLKDLFCDSKGNNLGWSREQALSFWKDGFKIINVSLVREGGLDADKPMVTITNSNNNFSSDNQQQKQALEAKANQQRIEEQQAQAKRQEQLQKLNELQAINQRQQNEADAQRQRYEQQYRQQQQAATDAQRQREAQALYYTQQAAKSRQQATTILNEGLNDIANTLIQIAANKQAADAERREQEKQNRIRDEQEKRQKEQEEIAENNRRNETARYEREKLEMERNNRINNRNYIFSTYTEANVPLSNTTVTSNKLFYFAYSYDKNRIAEQNLSVNMTNPFEIDRRGDGTWPFKNDILNDLSFINLSQIVFHGYYFSFEEAVKMQQAFVNYITKTGATIKSFTYKGKKSTTINSNTDFWGESTNKSSSNDSTNQPKQEVKQEADFWGAPIKK